MISPLRPQEARDILPPSKLSDMLLLSSRERGDLLTNLKLQKLLYYAQAWFLALHDRELFREDFEAWVHGPVLPTQYHRFKHRQWQPIMDTIYGPSKSGNILIDRHLGEILDVFGSEPAGSLELMTHREWPWLEARRGIQPNAASNRKISKETMKKYYSQLAKETHN